MNTVITPSEKTVSTLTNLGFSFDGKNFSVKKSLTTIEGGYNDDDKEWVITTYDQDNGSTEEEQTEEDFVTEMCLTFLRHY